MCSDLDPAMSAAIDEAMLMARSSGEVPDTLHLYRRSAPTVSLGHFEKVRECVDIQAAQRHGVALVRRLSGGSAIYTDSEQLIYTVAVDRRSVPESPLETFRLLCGGVIEALGAMGLKAEFKPVNDVQVRGRKISGSAQVRRHGAVVQHGTLLVRTDYRRMFEVLRWNKRSPGEMTSLAEELSEVPGMDELRGMMAEGFSAALGVRFVRGPLAEGERHLAEELARTRYGSAQHTFLH
ncbi:MAG: biotin/lipoate A/B protein ligase family protein [Methanomassiliicoccus sp.]|nr:biotin/lipoate A/B protein ligase family protein [Methanomassiliicoccus sp.]